MYSGLNALYEQIVFIAPGALYNLQYASIAVCIGFFMGALLALCKISNCRWLSTAAALYTSIFRGTPLLVQLSLIYFSLPSITGVKLSVFGAGIISFSLNSTAYISEIFRAGILSVDKGQFEAAQALGISKYHTYTKVILPQALRNVLPALLNEIIDLLKESSLISVLGGMDLMYRAQILSSQTYDYFTPMLIAASCYYAMILALAWVFKRIELAIKI